jgi:hypothetical protein
MLTTFGQVRSGRRSGLPGIEATSSSHMTASALTFPTSSPRRSPSFDPRAKGRFGIGLKTLGRLGERLTVNCASYHVTMKGNQVQAPSRGGRSLASTTPARQPQLLELILRPEFNFDEFRSWFA